MKYSVLLPTRNGGPFLRNCMLSILEQQHDDFELVVSDNANTDETPAILKEFTNDRRVKIVRLEEPVSVTDNWMNAFRASSGDYILMMGDDDYLLPGYFNWMDELLARHQQPDCVLYNAYSFVAPGSISGDQNAYFNEAHFSFSPDFQGESVMSPTLRRKVVRDMFRWKIGIPLNMQTTLISRQASELVKGGVFQPPFPDHYALNSLLLTARDWVFSPAKPLIVGISPKSFGHYVYSNHQTSGLAYLGINTSFPGELPGSPLTNGMHVWLNMLKAHYPTELKGIEIDRPGYVRRQVFSWVMQRRLGSLPKEVLKAYIAKLSWPDRLSLGLTLFDGASWERLLRFARGSRSDAEAQLNSLQRLEGVGDIREFGAWLERRNKADGRL